VEELIDPDEEEFKEVFELLESPDINSEHKNVINLLLFNLQQVMF
jgi:hypothetical protein